MYHVALRSVAGTPLFRSVDEALMLWRLFAARVRFVALALMPEHAHLQVADLEELRPIAVVMRTYALRRNAARGESGPVWEHDAQPTPIRGTQHEARTRRYIHLNPCRAGLVTDPLAWPFSTHRDACGLALPPACRVARDPARFHAFVSGDPAVSPAGTPLPGGRETAPTPLEVKAAVSALTRTTSAALRAPGPARDLLIRAVAALTPLPASQVAAFAHVSEATVRRRAAGRDAATELVARVAGDPRFPLLIDGPLPSCPVRSDRRLPSPGPGGDHLALA